MRADRLLSILLLLQANGRMTANTLARRLEVSERTILRDMDALSGAGVPVTAERGAGGGWRLIDGYQTKLTGLTATEIQTLFLGRPPKLLADLGLKEAAEGAWIKLQASLPVEVRAQAEFVRQRILIDPRGWRDVGESLLCLPVLLEALWRGRQLRFVYERGTDGGERLVTPLGLVARASSWYLVADKGEQRRTYRVSRIRQAAVLDEPCARPAGFDLAAHWEQSSSEFREGLPRFYATFRVTPSAIVWIRYRGSRVVEEVPDGDGFRVRMRFEIEDEAVHLALGLGHGVELLEPATLRERVRAGAEALVRVYAAESSSPVKL
ncbi:MAG TPA: YafY family protein [Gammaproteobacteria bacterium]|nr:YafY family protein [Gammaproteobacteria bacterium]